MLVKSRKLSALGQKKEDDKNVVEDPPRSPGARGGGRWWLGPLQFPPPPSLSLNNYKF